MEDLGDDEFEKFKWYLQKDAASEDPLGISKAQVERPDRESLAVQLLKTYNLRLLRGIK